MNDSALVDIDAGKLAYTTDTFVVAPLVFPGGDIGSLAVDGTVNDLSVMGAEPRFLSCGFIIEEGLEVSVLEDMVKSMKQAADEAGVSIVTGDTKVVERGAANRLFINTSGIGVIQPNAPDGDIQPGDKIIINGTIGDHGMSVLLARNEFEIEGTIESDCAPLNGLINEILKAEVKIKFMRDATRGGLATVLNECVENREIGVTIEETAIPVKPQVNEVCELLGFDPLYIANEGKVVIIASPNDTDQVLDVVRSHKYGKDAAIIGEVTTDRPGKVTLNTIVSGQRIVDLLVSDQFPRIC
jgi:hydrogenase expression/formation protein HypE